MSARASHKARWPTLAARKLSLLHPRSPISVFTREGRARRRFNCDGQAYWGERAEAAVGLLLQHESQCRTVPQASLMVGDLGAGNERLRPILARGLTHKHEYWAYDLHPQLPTTAPLDVTQSMPARDLDVGFCLGLLEYILDLQVFLARLGRSCRFALISYVPCPEPTGTPTRERTRRGWVTHMCSSELEQAFRDAGFTLVGTSSCDHGATCLWLLSSTMFGRGSAQRSPMATLGAGGDLRGQASQGPGARPISRPTVAPQRHGWSQRRS